MSDFHDLSALDLNNYFYELPEEKIATNPRKERDQSKLLVYTKGGITHDVFKNISEYLPENSLLFFNDTKVIPARIYFYKTSGSLIEVFLLQPESPTKNLHEVMAVTETCRWVCLIGNMKKWKMGSELMKNLTVKGENVRLTAHLIDRDSKIIEFRWDNPNISFAMLIDAAGEIPLPPYIKRKANDADKPGYQTVYRKNEGAVAAPTAGLHFTNDLLQKLENQKIKTEYLTLHVSAGTFQPIKESNVKDHPMHAEQICITKNNLEALISGNVFTVAVGTTSLRTLESTYWFGVKLLKTSDTNFHIEKLFPYQWKGNELPTMKESVSAVLQYMSARETNKIYGSTEIFIFPGYNFQICSGLVTNYHLPGSTLILLVAAFVGKDWRKIYDEALNNQYTFLSYGDSSLLIR